ncbi:MAG: hypothetical protein A2161_08085 [Candidatus Schekmanbacteria bacterium RBG_13_48_7]|uniref:PTS EIIA type-2 domain-containing protein n=1 Tax=Candidatus Schekmanbacteria bacterium RBG_13_48_7 TaxID=1817878 RepID=A0A1F7RXN0_9BACT|nr:MAG: hypothetical protein A2161_08085 [Candidatus Schekmanbacteria bacterium RBG_13_48_7]
MFYSRIRIFSSFHFSRMLHGIATIFHPFKSRNGGSPLDSAGLEENVNKAPLVNSDTSQETAVLEKLELCSEEYNIPELDTVDRIEAIKQLCEKLKTHPGMLDYKKFCAEVLKRENLKSTAIGNFLAIPHARSESVNQIVLAVGKSSKALNFEIHNGSPINYIVLIGTPMDQVKGYLKLLARIVRMFKNNSDRETLLDSKTSTDIAAIFRAHINVETT